MGEYDKPKRKRDTYRNGFVAYDDPYVDPYQGNYGETYSATSYKLATVSGRFWAQIIDNILLSSIASLLLIGVGPLGAPLSMMLFLGYQVYFWVQNNGQTIGKAALNIRVVKQNGTPITVSDAVLRYVGYFINNLFWPLWFVPFFNRGRKGIQDMIAGTYVVEVQSAQKIVQNRTKRI